MSVSDPLSGDDRLVNIGRVALAFILLLTYPLFFQPLRDIIFRALASCCRAVRWQSLLSRITTNRDFVIGTGAATVGVVTADVGIEWLCSSHGNHVSPRTCKLLAVALR